ncbi:DUF2235 domain-containing protein [Rhodohalobacter sp. SW132]|uniref:DUF2235 domain-containing protein n=1 Tax=Rhodohalobacter sp. SW132 TaxID=2293433 RepID=UPI000E239753|nr:DUF2235 domain-containing protein [Rhodohalobacter sp. SW132]REL33391.1 DUF2235 domain-containing protein [Rhodohalobacter sp. SW132]
MKRIILCCDGTWNSADQSSNGIPCPTNVVRIAYRIAKRKDDIQQIVYYSQGVGTGNSLDRFTGGAFGRGVDDNIFDIYRFLVANYEPDDQLFLFGFSRGAFTARSIAGMIRKCGILKREEVERYMNATYMYRSDDSPNAEIPTMFRHKYSVNGDQETPIHFIGVWDTVGSLGIPLSGLRNLTKRKHQFHDTELSGSVKNAFHALAINEQRSPFKPTLWQFKPKEGQSVEQMWFPGVHSNVGGGYTDYSLTDFSLEWMVQKAQEAGLVFDHSVENRHPLNPNCKGEIIESRKGIYRVLKPHNRVIGISEKIIREEGIIEQVPDPTQKVHKSALDRWDKDSEDCPPELAKYLNRTSDERA